MPLSLAISWCVDARQPSTHPTRSTHLARTSTLSSVENAETELDERRFHKETVFTNNQQSQDAPVNAPYAQVNAPYALDGDGQEEGADEDQLGVVEVGPAQELV
jgi:hypothetical protein